MEGTSKIIRDIDTVEQFRKILIAGYTVPILAGVILYAFSYLISAAKISSPEFHLVIFLIFCPPVIFYLCSGRRKTLWLVNSIYFVSYSSRCNISSSNTWRYF